MNRDEILKKEMKLAEEIFGTASDPDQIPITDESVTKFDKICDNWLTTESDENGEPVSWSVVLPTQRKLAEKFLSKEITERELLDLTEPAKEYDALYFVSVITVPAHRRKGLATKVVQRSLENMPLTNDALLFAWPTTTDGEKLTDTLEKVLGKKINIRS